MGKWFQRRNKQDDENQFDIDTSDDLSETVESNEETDRVVTDSLDLADSDTEVEEHKVIEPEDEFVDTVLNDKPTSKSKSLTIKQHTESETEKENAEVMTEKSLAEIEKQLESVAQPEGLEDLPSYLEDLSVIKGQVIPELVVPNWREELEFAKQRIEPCDLSHHLVKVTQRRWFVARVEQLLLSCRLRVVQRFYDRATRRFKDKLDEEVTLSKVLIDLQEWRHQQRKSVAWLLAERVDEEVQKAFQAQQDAIQYVERESEFRNEEAIKFYRNFVGRAIFYPVFYLYLASVNALTFNWLSNRIVPFERTPIVKQIIEFIVGLELSSVLVILGAIFGALWLGNLWKYAKTVSRVQKKVIQFNKEYAKQKKTIGWAVSEHTRLSQQQPLVEPLLEVLARGYRVQLKSNVGMKATVTTEIDVQKLPASVTVARAIDTDDDRMTKLRVLALRNLLKPGWRTNGLNAIAKYYAQSNLLGSNNLSLSKLDTDSTVGANNSRQLLLKAFSDTKLHDKVSLEQLRETIKTVHATAITDWDSEYRPDVQNLRDDGFDKSSFATSWLLDETLSEDWIKFLSEILGETTPFNQFNIEDKNSDLNKAELIKSVAVVPNYFDELEHNEKIVLEKSPSQEVMPIDVVVRVDVSPWEQPHAFAVFADGESPIKPQNEYVIDADEENDTSA